MCRTRRHWNCVWILSVFTCVNSLLGFFARRLGESNAENWLPKTFSCTPDWFHVSSGNLLSRLSNERELQIIAHLLETSDQTSSHCKLTPHLENLQNHSWSSFVLAPLATEKWVFVMSHEFLLIFCTGSSSTRSSWALFDSPITCMLRKLSISENLFFTDNSSSRRTCSRPDSTNPYCASL